jgi:hypothetical protein
MEKLVVGNYYIEEMKLKGYKDHLRGKSDGRQDNGN